MPLKAKIEDYYEPYGYFASGAYCKAVGWHLEHERERVCLKCKAINSHPVAIITEPYGVMLYPSDTPGN